MSSDDKLAPATTVQGMQAVLVGSNRKLLELCQGLCTQSVHGCLQFIQQARALARELQTYEIRVNARAHATFGAFKPGTHDDLVTALGLATQERSSADRAGEVAALTRPWVGGISVSGRLKE